MGTPHGDLEPGLFTNGGRVFFDDLVIEGTLSKSWLEERHVATFLESDLDSPSNRLKKWDLKALKALAGFEKGEVEVGELLSAIGNRKVVVFIRKALAEALAASDRVEETLDGLEALLRSKDLAARSFANLVLSAAVAIDFGFLPYGNDDERKEALARIMDYIENRA